MIARKIVHTSHLSLCRCGFPVLNESIPLGTEYEVDALDIKPGSLICGGCGNTIKILLIYVFPKGTRHAGYLPFELFDIADKLKLTSSSAPPKA